MSGIESAAVFESRALAIGISQATLTALTNAGLDTFGKYAFSCSYQPGSSDEAPLKDLLTTVLGAEPNVGTFAPLWRLYFEAHTLALSDMRQRVERREDEAPRKLPVPERAVRLDKQKRRLTGLKLEGSLLPSHGLVDKICQQMEDSQLKYVAIQECTSRDQELVGVKKLQQVSLDSSGNLKVGSTEASVKTDLSTDMKVREAFMRRSLAYDQCGMVSCESLDSWTDKLFRAMDREPPKGYRKVSLDQVLAADKELWTLVAESTSAGVAPLPDGTKPVDDAINMLKNSAEVSFLLLPLPSGSSASQQNVHQQIVGANKDVIPPTKYPRPIWKGESKGDGKGSGKKGKDSNYSPPASPAGRSRKFNGKPICINFNTKGCNYAKAGKRCKNGFQATFCKATFCKAPFARLPFARPPFARHLLQGCFWQGYLLQGCLLQGSLLQGSFCKVFFYKIYIQLLKKKIFGDFSL